jgi:hypothetical protein
LAHSFPKFATFLGSATPERARPYHRSAVQAYLTFERQSNQKGKRLLFSRHSGQS